METIDRDIIDLVIARLQYLPEDKDISIGAYGEFTKDDIIQHVRDADEIGKKMIEVEMNYLRLMKEGVFYAEPKSIGDLS
ncbi:hypothetical protein GCM10023093_07280 [Nemorincola caseinilytica]|uniref:Uncharacterized protein n=1 Tax=Nemorincola caseinilytica TaxID=2054315 RepID=A0ABP8N5T1_9BACT